MAKFDNFIDLAERLIEKSGTTFTLRRYAASSSFPTMGNVTRSHTDYTIKAVMRTATGGKIEAFDNSQSVGLVDERVRNLLVSAKSCAIEPKSDDRIVIGSNEYAVLGCTPISPDGVAIVYSLTYRV